MCRFVLDYQQKIAIFIFGSVLEKTSAGSDEEGFEWCNVYKVYCSISIVSSINYTMKLFYRNFYCFKKVIYSDDKIGLQIA